MKLWKFRAECASDVACWILEVNATTDRKLVGLRITTPVLILPDVEVSFSTDDPYGLVGPMHAVADGHVMWETLAPAARYTGERTYEVES